jgi:hypothetical protein
MLISKTGKHSQIDADVTQTVCYYDYDTSPRNVHEYKVKEFSRQCRCKGTSNVPDLTVLNIN